MTRAGSPPPAPSPRRLRPTAPAAKSAARRRTLQTMLPRLRLCHDCRPPLPSRRERWGCFLQTIWLPPGCYPCERMLLQFRGPRCLKPRPTLPVRCQRRSHAGTHAVVSHRFHHIMHRGWASTGQLPDTAAGTSARPLRAAAGGDQQTQDRLSGGRVRGEGAGYAQRSVVQLRTCAEVLNLKNLSR